jgi:hypothetical protein
VRGRLQAWEPRQKKAGNQKEAVVGEVCPVVDQVLQSRPALAHGDLNDRERQDRCVHPQGRHAAREPLARAEDAPEEGQIQNGEGEEIGDEPEVRPGEAREVGEEGRQKLKEAFVERCRGGQA